MWRMHWSVYQDHMEYIHNDIVNPFKVKIPRYNEPLREIYVLAKYLHPPSMKDKSAEEANWAFCNQ